jgi:hypothetical protein
VRIGSGTTSNWDDLRRKELGPILRIGGWLEVCPTGGGGWGLEVIVGIGGRWN